MDHLFEMTQHRHGALHQCGEVLRRQLTVGDLAWKYRGWRSAIISNAGIMTSRPERLRRRPISQPSVKWSVGISSCSRCSTTEVGISAFG